MVGPFVRGAEPYALRCPACQPQRKDQTVVSVPRAETVSALRLNSGR